MERNNITVYVKQHAGMTRWINQYTNQYTYNKFDNMTKLKYKVMNIY